MAPTSRQWNRGTKHNINNSGRNVRTFYTINIACRISELLEINVKINNKTHTYLKYSYDIQYAQKLI